MIGREAGVDIYVNGKIGEDKMKEVTAEEFKKKTGHLPVQDDLERCNCKLAGQVGHLQCGWCKVHDQPRFICGCIYDKEKYWK